MQWLGILVLCAFYCVKFSACESSECLFDFEDYLNNEWLSDETESLMYASNSEELPSIFQDKPQLKSLDGIMYFEGLELNPPVTQSLLKQGQSFQEMSITYIYIKYYVHVEDIAGKQAYVFPIKSSDSEDGVFQDLEFATDFQWREHFYEVEMKTFIENPDFYLDVGISNFQNGDYILIDTIDLVQGVPPISNISEFQQYCPLRATSPTTLSTTDATTSETSTDAATAPGSPTTTEISPTDTTLDTTIDSSSTTKEPPHPNPKVLECIDDEIHFDFYKWNSFPRHNFAENSLGLPAIFQGKLIARGILYFDGSRGAPHQQLYKPNEELNSTSPTFLYVKYYFPSTGLETCPETAYIAPVVNSSGSEFKRLNASADFAWKEELVEINLTRAVETGIEISLVGSDEGSFLFIDEIMLSQGVVIDSIESIVALCRPQY